MSHTLLGFKSTCTNQVEHFQMHHSSGLVNIFKLRLPAAIPDIIAGFNEFQQELSIIGAIVGETLIGSGREGGGHWSTSYIRTRELTSLSLVMAHNNLLQLSMGFAMFTDRINIRSSITKTLA